MNMCLFFSPKSSKTRLEKNWNKKTKQTTVYADATRPPPMVQTFHCSKVHAADRSYHLLGWVFHLWQVQGKHLFNTFSVRHNSVERAGLKGFIQADSQNMMHLHVVFGVLGYTESEGEWVSISLIFTTIYWCVYVQTAIGTNMVINNHPVTFYSTPMTSFFSLYIYIFKSSYISSLIKMVI